jgi:transcriptional regulator with XRE-family HTH domain
MNYAKAFRTIRSAKGITQKELAEVLGVDASYVSRIEASDKKDAAKDAGRIPSTQILEKISSSFSVPFYLIALLASEEEDLKRLPVNNVDELSLNLLKLLESAKNDL